MNPSDEYIDECMKLLKRFLKEKGKYQFIMRYLFKFGRGKRQFYESVKDLYGPRYYMDFGDIFHIVTTLGPGDEHFDWEEYIEPLCYEFECYFDAHKHKIKNYFN